MTSFFHNKAAVLSRPVGKHRRFAFAPIFAAMLGLLCLLAGLVACGSSGRPLFPPKGNPLATGSGHFEATAAITYRSLRAAAVITRTTPQSCRVLFTAPDSLAGMGITFGEQGVEMTYDSLAGSFALPLQALPGGALAPVLAGANSKAMTDRDAAMAMAGELLTLQSSTERGTFTLWIDPKTGAPLKLSFPAEELEISFARFTFLP